MSILASQFRSIIMIVSSLVFFCTNTTLAQKNTLLGKTHIHPRTIESKITINEDSIRNEIKDFISIIKPQSIKQGYYNVYMIKVFADSTDKAKYCYTLGYIYNWFDLKYISFNFYCEIDSEIILMSLDENAPKVFTQLGFEKADTSNFKKTYSKLYPREKGGITGFGKGKVICISANQVEKVYYPDEDNIPPERSIFEYRISKESIREIKR